MMKKIGLVLAGGGGKGAYHIGVWKALSEYGVDNRIQAVAGTSIGALNAALFVQGDLDIAEKIWLDISHEKVLKIKPEKVIAILARYGLKVEGLPQLQRWLLEMENHGLFKREGLLEIIGQSLNVDYISSSQIKTYATCCELPLCCAKYFGLNNESHENITKILLASSALPIIYEPIEIDGREYMDGGLPLAQADNVPVKPLYDEGCNMIFVVHLSREYVIDADAFPDAQIIEIVPQDDQGGLFSGTLDFTGKGAARRIEQGYNDAVKILKPIFDMAMTQVKVTQSLQTMQRDEQQFRAKRETLLEERHALMSELNELMKLD